MSLMTLVAENNLLSFYMYLFLKTQYTGKDVGHLVLLFDF
jgi:hypothetical protein